MSDNKEQLITEKVIRSLVESVGTKNFMVSLHNAFSFGSCIEDAGEYIDEDDLQKMYRHFDKLIKISKRVT